MPEDPHAILRTLHSLVNDRLLTADAALRYLDHAGIPRKAWTERDDATR